MRRRQFLPSVAAVASLSVPLAGCAAPVSSSPTPLSDPEETVADGRETLVYRHDDERFVEFSATAVDTADNVSFGDLTPFTLRVERADRLAFDSVRYAFTTSSSSVPPVVYVQKLGTTEFPAFTFVEDGESGATVLLIDEFDQADYPAFPMRFLLREDELPTDLTVAARNVVAERDGGRRYVAQPTTTVQLARQ